MKKIGEVVVESLLVGMPGFDHGQLTMDLEGIREDPKHYGMTRIADSRTRPDVPKPVKGSIDENWRQFSAISVEDLNVIQQHYQERYGMAVGRIQARWLGPN